MLIARAGEKLGVPADGLFAKDGEVMRKNGGPGVAYAQLIGGRDFEMKVNEKVALKPPSTYTIVGKSVRRIDIPGKVTGRFTYMQDVKVPNMVHARVIRPAAMKSDLQSYDDAAAKKIPGYLSTVRKGNFLVVVARDEWAAIRCANAMEANGRLEGFLTPPAMGARAARPKAEGRGFPTSQGEGVKGAKTSRDL